MGGMFSVVKVREGLARNDYKDPGWYQHPSGTVAYAHAGAAPIAEKQPSAQPTGQVLRARKPGAHSRH
jgi:hypothetical protein